MSSKYHIEIAKQATLNGDGSGEREGLISAAFGSLKLVSLAAKEGLTSIADKDGDFAANFVEMTDNGEREVTRVKGSARVVALVLSDAIKQERKQAANAAANEPESGVA